MFISRIPPSTVFINVVSVSSNFLLILFASFVRNSLCMISAVIEIKETALFEESDVIVLTVIVLLQYNYACCFVLA